MEEASRCAAAMSCGALELIAEHWRPELERMQEPEVEDWTSSPELRLGISVLTPRPMTKPLPTLLWLAVILLGVLPIAIRVIGAFAGSWIPAIQNRAEHTGAVCSETLHG